MTYNVNYAESYSKALANAYPHVLQFGELWNTENKAKYKIVDAKTIKIPVMDTSGRVDGDRDSINLGLYKRNHSNNWETKTLKRHRTWSTLIHPQDIAQSGMIETISNATQVMNETQKVPELDCELIYDVRQAFITAGGTPVTTKLTKDNVLTVFDDLMAKMDEARVPKTGRICYVDTFTKQLIDNAKEIVRQNGDGSLQRAVSRIGEVTIKSVTTDVMKTNYNFAIGAVPAEDAKQIHMFIVHPSCILPVPSYDFVGVSEPTAMTQGKAVYFEESFEDFFILNRRKDAIAFVEDASAEG